MDKSIALSCYHAILTISKANQFDLNKHMEQYPDYRAFDEQAEYEYFKSKDYSKEKNYKVLFSDLDSYLRAVRDMTHSFHKEALQIWKNRTAKNNLVYGESSLGEDAYQNYRTQG